MGENMDSDEKNFFIKYLERIEKHQGKTCDELKDLKDDVHKIDKTVGCLDERVTAYMDLDDKKTNTKWMKLGLIITSVAAVGAVSAVIVVI